MTYFEYVRVFVCHYTCTMLWLLACCSVAYSDMLLRAVKCCMCTTGSVLVHACTSGLRVVLCLLIARSCMLH
jgi:hypothetical protein